MKKKCKITSLSTRFRSSLVRAGARTKRDDDVDTPDHRCVRTDRGVRARRVATHRDVVCIGGGGVKGGRGRRERRRRVHSNGTDDDDDERRRHGVDVNDGNARRDDAEGV